MPSAIESMAAQRNIQQAEEGAGKWAEMVGRLEVVVGERFILRDHLLCFIFHFS